MKIRALVTTGLALCTLGVSCGITTPDVEQTGTVKYVAVEGGCWVIETADETYEPINLPEALQTDGLAVSFEAEVREDLASICQVGTLIELLRIRPNEG